MKHKLSLWYSEEFRHMNLLSTNSDADSRGVSPSFVSKSRSADRICVKIVESRGWSTALMSVKRFLKTTFVSNTYLRAKRCWRLTDNLATFTCRSSASSSNCGPQKYSINSLTILTSVISMHNASRSARMLVSSSANISSDALAFATMRLLP